MKSKISTIFFVFVMGLSSAYAQTDENAPTSQMATQIANEIYSPFCPGKTLAMCPSPDAAKVRRQIQKLARDGKDKQQIKEVIITEYGEEFRLVEPPATDNFGLLGGVVGGLALAVFAVMLVSRRGKEDEPSPQSSPIDDDSPADDDDQYLDQLRKQYQD